MTESVYVGSYWKARMETAEACATRAGLFFHILSTCDQSFAQWFKKGMTIDEASTHPILTDSPHLLERFRQQIPEGEFSIRAWNGMPAEGSSISLSCGNASVRATNLCLIDPPEEGPAADRLSQAPPLAQILRSMVVAWEPEWGVVTSHSLRDLQKEKNGWAGTFLGWITYFSHRRGVMPPLPSTVRVEPVEDKGSLVILTPERFSTTQPEHMDRVRTVAPLLQQAGLLGPLTPWDR